MQTATETASSEVIKFEEISAVMANAGEILAKNQRLTKMAVDKAIALIDTIEGQGMSAELDKELNDWQVKAKQALIINYDRRTPITQMANMITKAYTAEEAPLDGTKKDSYYAKVQTYRNIWAKECAQKEQARIAEIKRKQDIEKEKIELKAKAESQIREAFLTKLYDFKRYGAGKVSSMTLQNIEENKKAIQDLKITYPRDKFNELAVSVSSIYMDKAELAGLIFDTRTALYDELSANFTENMEALKLELLDLVPSKKLELEEMARAGEAKRKEMEAEAEKRRLSEEAAMKAQQAEAQKQAEANIQAQQSMDKANTLFDTAAQMAEVKDANTSQVRQGYKINVHSAAGWGAIFMFYFEKEGMTLSVEDFGKKTLNQMKAFCEKHAHKTSEKIENIALTYEEDFKAIATKEK